ncbi:MAG: hypothetical protein CL755_12635 [Chloroflexi bacterium]|nr:hypothetical protein [Chloroflexota bacterium]|tara:strand:- start:658 stop:948 length:291 start_codon:yes stop_codon:yes gene_type:complete
MATRNGNGVKAAQSKVKTARKQYKAETKRFNAYVLAKGKGNPRMTAVQLKKHSTRHAKAARAAVSAQKKLDETKSLAKSRKRIGRGSYGLRGRSIH